MIGVIVPISTGAFFCNHSYCSKGDGIFYLETDDNLAGTLALGKTEAFVATISTASIDENICFSIYAEAIGDCLS